VQEDYREKALPRRGNGRVQSKTYEPKKGKIKRNAWGNGKITRTGEGKSKSRGKKNKGGSPRKTEGDEGDM